VLYVLKGTRGKHSGAHVSLPVTEQIYSIVEHKLNLRIGSMLAHYFVLVRSLSLRYLKYISYCNNIFALNICCRSLASLDGVCPLSAKDTATQRNRP